MTTYFRDHESKIIIRHLKNNLSELQPEYQFYYTKLLSALFNEHPIPPIYSNKQHEEAVRAVCLLRGLPDEVTDNIELNENKALLFLAKKMKKLTLEEGKYACQITPDMSTMHLNKIRPT
jgi:hypothetical protein